MSGNCKGCQSCATQHAPNTEQTCGNCAESTPLNRTWIRCEARSVEHNGVYHYEETHPAWVPGCASWKEAK